MDNLTDRLHTSVHVLRLDKIHPVISGNKWFKLKYHLLAAKKKSSQFIVTFGGAWSNHLVAAACAAQQEGFRSIGIIRGEKPELLSHTLRAAADYGMHLEYKSRQEYKDKDEPAFLDQVSARWPGAYIIPEGGAGELGIQGSEDILRSVDSSPYSHILCAIGTGTMYRGLVKAAAPGQTIVGFPVLKGMTDLSATGPVLNGAQSQIVPGYHFGGYARSTPALLDFMNRFFQTTGIPSDFVYTGKLFYGAMDLLEKGFFSSGSRLLLIHSGGLQGNQSLSPGILYF